MNYPTSKARVTNHLVTQTREELMTKLPVFSVIFCLNLLSTGPLLAGELDFSFDDSSQTCKNSRGDLGYNEGLLIECGRLEEENLGNSDFSNLNLKGINLSDSSLYRSDLTSSNLAHAFLFGTDFHAATLSHANLSFAIMRKTSFRYAGMSGAEIIGAKLIRADLVSTNLQGVNLSNSTLLATNLDSADLTGADLRGTDFGGNDYFEPSNLEHAWLKGAKFDARTKLPFSREEAIKRGMEFIP
jgi:uncharacterized protein YjbI with pentapeptide repeats